MAVAGDDGGGDLIGSDFSLHKNQPQTPRKPYAPSGQGGLENSMGKLIRGDDMVPSTRPRDPSSPTAAMGALAPRTQPPAPPPTQTREIARPSLDAVTRIVAAPNRAMAAMEVATGVSSLGRGLTIGVEGAPGTGVSVRGEPALQSSRLMRGMQGHAVEALQLALSRGGFDLDVTGFFDDVTGERLADFQRSVGLEGTGVADPETRVMLAWTRVSLGAERLQLGSRGHAVCRLRELLALPADDQARATIFDDPCDHAVRRFQVSVRLNPDGVVNREVARELEWRQVQTGRMQLNPGRRGPVVEKLQAMLARACGSTAQTGVFTASMTESLRLLQSRYGLAATGQADAPTLALLRRLLERTDPQAVTPSS